MTGTPKHLSCSQIGMYQNCPRSYGYKYIKGRTAKANAAMLFGSAFHDTVEQAVITSSQTGELINLQDAWKVNWIKRANKEQGNFDWNGDSVASILEQGRWIFGQPAIRHQIEELRCALEYNGKPLVEIQIKVYIPGVEVPIIGYVDMVDQEGIGYDFKTSNREWGQDRIDDAYLQPAIYTMGLSDMGITNQGNLFRHLIFVKSSVPYTQQIDNTIGETEISKAIEATQKTWNGILAGDFHTERNNQWCSPKWCPFWQECKED